MNNNPFIVRNGLVVDGDGVFTGSLSASAATIPDITGSLFGTASWALTASFAMNGGGGGTGSANTVSSSAQLSNGGGVAFDNTNNVTFGQITASALLVTEFTASVVLVSSSIRYQATESYALLQSPSIDGFTTLTGSTATTNSTTPNQVIYTLPANVRSAKFNVTAIQGSRYHVTELMAIFAGGGAANQYTAFDFSEYGTLTITGSCAYYNFSASGAFPNYVNLVCTPLSASTTTYYLSIILSKS